MSLNVDKVKTKLDICRESLKKGYGSVFDGGFLNINEEEEALGDVYLCLTQIMVCIKYLEKTIQLEIKRVVAISAARQHFLDRLYWRLEHLWSYITSLSKKYDEKVANITIEENSFVALMDFILEQIKPFTNYKGDDPKLSTSTETNVSASVERAILVSTQVRDRVNIVIGHTLSFANVALEADKKALSALSQTVLRECIAWQTECQLRLKQQNQYNVSNCRVKASSLEIALYKLEDFINESLLRLVYRCLLDFEKFSIEKLRILMNQCGPDDPTMDEIVADFDVNLDRTTQIGIFAVCFAPNKQIGTLVRNCLASFESLDSCIIPSLYEKGSGQLYSQLLECHFKEEVKNFKTAILEIADSQEFTVCFYDLLNQYLKDNEKNYNSLSLQEITQMGEILKQHFLLPINQKFLLKSGTCFELFKKFCIMLSECQAILQTCECVDTKRVIKRFKILRSKLHKLIKGLSGGNDCSEMFMHSGKESGITSAGIKSSLSVLSKSYEFIPSDEGRKSLSHAIQHAKDRRKDSLRTAMFRRQKSAKTEELFNSYKNFSESLQITVSYCLSTRNCGVLTDDEFVRREIDTEEQREEQESPNNNNNIRRDRYKLQQNYETNTISIKSFSAKNTLGKSKTYEISISIADALHRWKTYRRKLIGANASTY
uniref:Serendipity locus protein alpha n=1 Tax=Glossina austeni TaxID=7395 RepID=A0A1A9UVK4_GLOAU